MIPHTPLRGLDTSNFSNEGQALAEELRSETLKQISKDYNFRRDDYKELIELSMT